ncbi:Actin-like protein arp9 (SWI/SNF complex component arp9) [Ascosphaera pollenicola]|nr:Actin-like protein arp9 (SWI/SNF complex component arp9) [Ascosphaera pollenicola]
MAPFKDEHILLLAPGSQITQAQLGLPESFTPARFRFPTRMFPAEKKGEWEPYRVREKTITVKRRVPKPPPSPSPEVVAADENQGQGGNDGGGVKMGEDTSKGSGEAETAAAVTGQEGEGKTANEDSDVEMKDAPEVKKEDGKTTMAEEKDRKESAEDTTSKPTEEQPSTDQQQQEHQSQPQPQPQQADDTPLSEKQEPQKQPSPPQPQSAVATAQSPKEPEPEFIEIEEQQKVFQEDPSSEEGAVFPIRNGAIVDWPCFFAVLTHIYNTLSPPFHTPIIMVAQPCWTLRDREIITQFIFEKFKTPAFCLLDSALAVCYAYGVTTATVIDVGHGKADVTAAIDSIVHEHGRGIALEGCGGDAITERLYELLQSKGFSREMCEQLKRSNVCEVLSADTPLPGSAETVSLISDAEAEASKMIAREQETRTSSSAVEDDEGVLNVAAIVTGNTTEILAQKEREKAERLAAKKGAAAEAAARALRLPNSKRDTNTFQYSSYVPVQDENGVGVHHVLRTKDVEVGQERFKALTPSESNSPDALMFGILETIAAQVHHTITSVPEMHRRGELWDSIIVVGNGSKLKGTYKQILLGGICLTVTSTGFSQALISTIIRRYLLSPSTGTILTAELPSQYPTPAVSGGTNTPANVNTPNPYLVATTTAQNNPTSVIVNPNDPAQSQARGPSSSQTPMSVKTLKTPEYFPEFKAGAAAAAAAAAGTAASGGAGSGAAGASQAGAGGNANGGAGAGTGVAGLPGMTAHNAGFEEAMFLGAQVAAKIVFMLDQGMSKGYLSRPEYNDVGPSGIHECGL